MGTSMLYFNLCCGHNKKLVVLTRLVTLASGAASGKFLKYEQDAPAVGSQTAYGIEAEVEGYEDKFPENLMVFMDYRRHHTGLWNHTAHKLKVFITNLSPISGPVAQVWSKHHLSTAWRFVFRLESIQMLIITFLVLEVRFPLFSTQCH